MPCNEPFDKLAAKVIAAAAKRSWVKVKERLGREIDRDRRLHGASKGTAMASRVARLYLDHLHRKHGYAWCSASYVAEELGVSVSTIERANALLLRAGIIVRKEVRYKDRASRRWITTLPGVYAVDQHLEAERSARDGAATLMSGLKGKDPAENSKGPSTKSDRKDFSSSNFNRMCLLHSEPVHPEEDPPLTPRTAGGTISSSSDRKRLQLIDELRDEGTARHVVERLIAPLLSQRRLSDPEPLAGMRRLRDAAADLSVELLDAVANDVLEAFKAKFRPGQVADAITRRRKLGLMFVIKPGMPEWQRWCDHYRVHNPRRLEVMKRYCGSQEVTRWPPANKSRRVP